MILEIAERHNLYVIEDCSQAVSAEYYNKCVGSFGTIGVFSLHPLKTLNDFREFGMTPQHTPSGWELKIVNREQDGEYATRGGLIDKEYSWGNDLSIGRDYAHFGSWDDGKGTVIPSR